MARERGGGVTLRAATGDLLANGDLARSAGDLARAAGDLARSAGDLARSAGDLARATGDLALAIGDRTRGERRRDGDKAPRLKIKSYKHFFSYLFVTMLL